MSFGETAIEVLSNLGFMSKGRGSRREKKENANKNVDLREAQSEGLERAPNGFTATLHQPEPVHTGSFFQLIVFGASLTPSRLPSRKGVNPDSLQDLV